MSIALRPAPALSVALAAAAVVGCSNDRAVYLSTPHRPTSVAVIDTMTHKPLWSKDIPVNQKMTVDYNFWPGHTEALWSHKQPPSSMSWTLRPISTKTPVAGYYLSPSSKSGTVELSGNPVSTRVSIREVQRPEPVDQQEFNATSSPSSPQAGRTENPQANPPENPTPAAPQAPRTAPESNSDTPPAGMDNASEPGIESTPATEPGGDRDTSDQPQPQPMK